MRDVRFRMYEVSVKLVIWMVVAEVHAVCAICPANIILVESNVRNSYTDIILSTII